MIAGVETGGTKVVCARSSRSGRLDEVETFPTTTPDETLARVVAFLAQPAPRAVGIASFGPLDLLPTSPTYGTVRATLKPGWPGAPVRAVVAEAVGVPVAIETDVNAAALAERRWGAARGLDDVAYVTVGTGVGVGAIVAGQVLHGHAGTHPELGHLAVRRHGDDRFEGVCPFHGDCLEGLAGGPALARRWGRPAHELGDLVGPARDLQSHYLAQLVATLTYLLSPGRIVLGGGVLGMPGLLAAVRDRSAALVGRALSDHPVTRPTSGYLVAPGLGHRSGVHGALALAEDALGGRGTSAA